MASGHVNRIKRPNTWLHRPMLQNVKKALANPEPSTHDPIRTSGPRTPSGTAGYRSRCRGCEDECNFAFTLSPYRQDTLKGCTRGGSERGPYSSPMSFDDRSADR